MPAYNVNLAQTQEFGAADAIGPELEYDESLHEVSGSQVGGTPGGWDRCEVEAVTADAELEEEIESWD
jgi:hypothetical protein